MCVVFCSCCQGLVSHGLPPTPARLLPLPCQVLALISSVTRLKSACSIETSVVQEELLRDSTALRACVRVLGSLEDPGHALSGTWSGANAALGAGKDTDAGAALAFKLAAFACERDLLAQAIAEILSWEGQGSGAWYCVPNALQPCEQA